MARKKVVQTDNMTLTSEIPDDAIKDITGEDIEVEAKPKTLSQQQSLALSQVPEDKPSKKDIFEEPKTVVPIEDKIVVDCLNFLQSRRINANYGSNGNAHTCVLTDSNGNTLMPMDELRNKPTVAYGDDKNRALINAVNSYKSTLLVDNAIANCPPLQIEQSIEQVEAPKSFAAAYDIPHPVTFEGPTISPKVPDWSETLFPDNTAHELVSVLRKIIRQEIKLQMKDKEDIKSQIMDLVKKLENL